VRGRRTYSYRKGFTVADEKENNQEKKRSKRKQPQPQVAIADHVMTARWIQEQLLEELPELGLLSEKLIERILRLEHRRYLSLGHTRIAFVSEEKK